jgi:hypothetical protein
MYERPHGHVCASLITRSSLEILKEMENIKKEELTSNWIELFVVVVILHC